MKFKNLSYAVGIAALAMSGTASAVLVDNFTVAQRACVTDNGDVACETNATGIDTDINAGGLGLSSEFDDRTYIAELSNPAQNVDPNVISTDSSGGALNLTRGTDTTSMWHSTWDSATDVDFLAGGHDSIEYRVLENNAPFVELDFGFTDADGDTGMIDAGTIAFVLSGSPTNFDVLYTLIDNPAVDFDRIRQFSIWVDGTGGANGADLALDLIQSVDNVPDPGGVPIPAAVWLFGTGLVGLTGFNRRKKAAVKA